MQECYEGCLDSPNILDLCDPGTEEAAANTDVNDHDKMDNYHLTKKNIYIYKFNQK